MCLLAVCRILSSSPPRSLRLDALSKELVRSVSAESKRSTAGGGAHGGAGGRTVGAGGAKRLLTLHLRAVLMTLAQKVQLCSPAALCSSAPPMSHTLSAPYLRSLCALCALLRTRAAPSPPTSPPPVPVQMLGFVVGWAWFDAFHVALDGTVAPWGFACLTTAFSSLWPAP